MITTTLTLVSYSPEFKVDFERLNRLWLEADFWVEPVDEAIFHDPEGMIINKGGQIWVMADGNKGVGVAAWKPINETTVELMKMGVDPAYKGQGIGKQLMEHIIADVKHAGFEKLWLLSNQRLTAAMGLYQRFGFKTLPLTKEDQALYQRADISMALAL